MPSKQDTSGSGRDGVVEPAPVRGYDPWTLAARAELSGRGSRRLGKLTCGQLKVEIRAARNSLWAILTWPGGGGAALRCGYWPEEKLEVKASKLSKTEGEVRLIAPSAHLRAQFHLPASDTPLLRATVWLTPKTPLLCPFWPRDMLLLDEHRDPLPTRGTVHAAQRDSGAGVIYLTLAEPGSGTLLYLQNLTALNDYCRATETNLGHCVAGDWPLLGLSLPPAHEQALPADEEVILSDAFVRVRPGIPADEAERAMWFLDDVAEIYPHLAPHQDRPEPAPHDWPQRAEQTLRDLEEAKPLTTRKGGFRYIRPYTDAETPDSMVQLAVLLPMLDFLGWREEGQDVPLAGELRAGFGKFFNEKVGTVIRYLPTADDDKHAWKIDSWYLYHPLMNLGRLAQHGDEKERQLFLRSLEYGIKVAHHFDYRWPIDFDLKSLEPVTAQRSPGKPGESDVAGLYAYTMLQALALTGDRRFLDEAKRATNRLEGLGFEIGYQFNNVAWGVTACLGLWRTTGELVHQQRAYALLASFFHNTYLWDARFGPAEHYPTFLGVACLHDGPYMAAFEEFETCLAFQEALRAGGEELPGSIRLLMAEYCRHLLDRGWFYYPGELPEDIIAKQPRNGYIDRKLAIPLEDLYLDRQPAGQVGQEVYGCGLAFALTTSAFHRIEDPPGLLYCDYPLLDIEAEAGRATLGVAGIDRLSCRLVFLPESGQPTPKVSAALLSRGGQPPQKLKPLHGDPLEFRVPGGSRVVLSW